MWVSQSRRRQTSSRQIFGIYIFLFIFFKGDEWSIMEQGCFPRALVSAVGVDLGSLQPWFLHQSIPFQVFVPDPGCLLPTESLAGAACTEPVCFLCGQHVVYESVTVLFPPPFLLKFSTFLKFCDPFLTDFLTLWQPWSPRLLSFFSLPPVNSCLQKVCTTELSKSIWVQWQSWIPFFQKGNPCEMMF